MMSPPMKCVTRFSPHQYLFQSFLGLCGPLFGKRDIADRRVDPDIDHEIVAAGEFYAPFERPGDAPVMQLVLDPADRVVLRIARAFEPVEERQEVILEHGQFEEIMLLVTELRLCPADLADRVLDLTRFKVLAAPLVTLVPPCLLTTVGTGALDVPIRKEPPALRTVCLVDDLLINIPVFLRAFS